MTASIVRKIGAVGEPLGNAITVGDGGQYSTIQSAIDSITDNLPVNYSTGTVSVTNGSATITFSSAPAADKVVAGRDLFSVDGVRFYQILNGPTTAGGATFNLYEAYQGATNAAASFSIYKPNPRTILLLDPVYDFTGDTLARSILLKPYVGLVGFGGESTVIRRNTNNTTPETTPLIGLTHGSWLRNLAIDAVDGHFQPYRMGLTALATSQTQAMAGSRWTLSHVALLNKDPNGIDGGADYIIDSSYYNDDLLLLDSCYFEHCWDGFTFITSGAGRLKVVFKNPEIFKTPYPKSLTTGGAAFIRNGTTGDSSTDVEMYSPTYDQATFASGEVSTSGIAARAGCYGMAFAGSGGTIKVFDPVVKMACGANIGRIAAVGLYGTGAGSDLAASVEVYGGSIEITGSSAVNANDHTDGACNDYVAGTLVVHGTSITSEEAGVRQNNATARTDLRGGARIKGTANSLVNTAGTMNQSANVSVIGATSGVITSAET